MAYPYLTHRTDKDGIPTPTNPAEIPQHDENCPGCYGDGYQIVVGPNTGFDFAPKACDGRAVPDADHS